MKLNPPSSIVTIKDVAKNAEVSTATVSRVLSGSNLVSDSLRNRVLESIEALGYYPNYIGRNLRRQSTNIIGLVVTDIQNPFFTSILRGVQDILIKHELVILISNSDEDPEQELVQLQAFRAQGIIGLIFAPTEADYEDIQHLFEGIAVVAIDRKPMNLNVDTITVNNIEGALAATQHLISLGHYRIGFIAGNPNVTTGKERLQGYLEAIQHASFPIIDELIQDGSFTQQGGFNAMTRLLALHQSPTAIVSANNLMTLGALQAIHIITSRSQMKWELSALTIWHGLHRCNHRLRLSLNPLMRSANWLRIIY
jgi:LacI family transcriptional regulator